MTAVHQVVIVGAGFAGLAAALELRAAGIDDVVMIERAAQVGGTWRDNTYPGVACDVPALLYALRRHPEANWSHEFAPGAEIQAYLTRVATEHAPAGGIRLNTPLRGARWQGTDWELDTPTDPLLARSVVLACGRLTEPALPDVPGLATFPGRVVHSARWDAGWDVAGQHLAVVGTGASGIQLVPELVRRGARVTLFQRSAAWILPRGGQATTAAQRAVLSSDPAALDAERDRLYREGEARFASRAGDAAAAAAATDQALAHLYGSVTDRELRRHLTPDYAFGCKRVLLSDDFYPALASGAVALEPSALIRVDPDGTLVAASGRVHRADAVVLATGFQATRQPYASLIQGEHGQSLDAHWDQGMTSALSTVVAGFPNLFVLNGPNAALGHNSSILMLEEQAGYLARVIAGDPDAVRRVDPAAEDAYTALVQERAAATSWLTGGCRSWYIDDRSGRLTLLWPGTVAEFRELLAAADGSEFLAEPVTGGRSARS